MRDHPVTPAAESDLRLHLSAQTELPVAGLPWTSYGDPVAISAALAGKDTAFLVADAFTDDHLDQLAAAILDGRDDQHSGVSRFVLGSGGISGALGRAARPAEPLPELPTGCPAAGRPLLVLSGSTSRRTREQIAASAWTVVDLFAADAADRAVAELAAGRDVIVSSTAESAPASTAVDPTDDDIDISAALAAIGARVLHSAGIAPDRMIICGGDTAGSVLRSLGVDAISIVARPWGNAVLCRATSGQQQLDGLELVLKGGQMGHPTLFADVRNGTTF